MTAAGMYARGSQFRLRVMAPSVLDTVRFAGGWIFDQVRLGWTVSVAIPGDDDDRPLRVLGAESCDFDSLLTMSDAETGSASLAIAAELLVQNGKVQNVVRTALAHNQQHLLVWGAAQLPELSMTLESVEHRLSRAAMAFKAHALRAAAADVTFAAFEVFSGTRPSANSLMLGSP